MGCPDCGCDLPRCADGCTYTWRERLRSWTSWTFWHWQLTRMSRMVTMVQDGHRD